MLWKALPESLEELWLARAHQVHPPHDYTEAEWVPDCLLPALDYLLDHKTEAYPRLNHLIMEIPVSLWRNEWLDSLEAVCKRARASDIRNIDIHVALNCGVGGTPVERAWGWN
jgi:hypothetical protein